METFSPTPQPSGGLNAETVSTMEQRLSRNQQETNQLRLEHSTNRSLSVCEKDELKRRIQTLELQSSHMSNRIQELEAERERLQRTIHTQSTLIQGPRAAPQIFHQQLPRPAMNLNRQGPVRRDPPQFDPNRVIAGAESARRGQLGNFASPFTQQPAHGSFSNPQPHRQSQIGNQDYALSRYQPDRSERQGERRYDQDPPQTAFPQNSGGPNYMPPYTEMSSSPKPGTLGFGLTAGQRPQSTTPIHGDQAGHSNTSQIRSSLNPPPRSHFQPSSVQTSYDANQSAPINTYQNRPSQSSYLPSRSQPSSNRFSYDINQPGPSNLHQNQPSRSSRKPSQTSNQISHSSQSSFPQNQHPPAAPLNLGMSMALVRISNTAQELGYPPLFEKLFNMSERYAYAHVNFPSAIKDDMLTTYIKDKLTIIAKPDSAGNLMSNSQTRLFMVARIINQWICKHILKRTCFSGFDAQIDANVKQLSDSIYSTTPDPLRGQYLAEISQEINSLKRHGTFRNYFDKLCRDRGNDLWGIVKPLMHQKTSQDWNDLHNLMVEAHNLALFMQNGPYEWSLNFYNVNDPFIPETMINKDPFMKQPPYELQQGGAVVRLGVSPLIGFRTYKAASGVEANNVYSGMVLTKWPNLPPNQGR